MNKFVVSCSILGLLVGVASATATAQSQATGSSVQELHQELSELQAQVKKLQSRLDELEKKQVPTVTPQTEASPGTQPSTNAGQPLPQGPTSLHVGQETATYNTFSEDSIAAPRYDNIPLDPKYHGFFRLPGTQTILKIGGYFKTDFIYDLKPAGDADAFIPSSIPIPQVATVNNTTISVRPTRLNLDFRIPNTRIGEVRFYVEGDMFGTNATTPRVRHAYAQASNFLIGQTFSNFMDPDVFPDTLDFQGPNGIVSLRNPQIRYGVALGPRTTIYFSLEQPSSDILFTTPNFVSQPNAPSPDGTIRVRQEYERGHLQVAGIFRSVAAFVTSGTATKSDSVFGWGVNVSTGFRTIGKDNLVIAAAFGHGISRYIQDTSGLGIDAEVTSSANPHLKATPNFGAEAGYQHYWTKTLRSSAVFSYAAVRNTGFAPGNTYNHGDYSAANLIWNPLGSSLNMGVEFLYGWQQLKDGAKGNAPRIQFSAKYDYVKVGR